MLTGWGRTSQQCFMEGPGNPVGSGGLGGCTLEKGAQEQRQQTPQSTQSVTAGWDRGQIQAGTCCWISPRLRL